MGVQDGDRKVTTVIVSITFIFIAAFMGPVLFGQWRDGRILETGVPAKALVTNIRPTGSTYNDRPLVVVSIQVTPPEGKPFNAEVHTDISPVYLPRFQPGQTVDVRFDPEAPEDVALVMP